MHFLSSSAVSGPFVGTCRASVWNAIAQLTAWFGAPAGATFRGGPFWCRRFLRGVVVGVLTVCFVGCGEPPRPVSPQESRLRSLAVLYGRYIASPSNEREFVGFMQSSGAEVLAWFEVDDPEKLLVSPRDNQPYEINYGGSLASQWIAHEKVGVDGKRWIVDRDGRMQEIDEMAMRAVTSKRR